MTYPVNYEVEVLYNSLPGVEGMRPVLDVTLYRGEQCTSAIGVIDSGATHTIFSKELALFLGISDLAAGILLPMSTVGGSVQVYLFEDVEMGINVGGIHKRLRGKVGFADRHLPRNLLGRNILFEQFLIGFHESRQRFYLRTDLNSATSS